MFGIVNQIDSGLAIALILCAVLVTYALTGLPEDE